MKFKSIPHNPQLNTYVSSMWSLEYTKQHGDPPAFKEYALFANAYPALIFQYKGKGFLKKSKEAKNIPLPYCHFLGLSTFPMKLSTYGSFGLFGVSFYPNATRLLFDIEPYETNNNIINSELIIGNKLEALSDHLLLSKNNLFREQIISNFLKVLIAKVKKTEPIIDASLNFISLTNGQAPIGKLSDYLGYSTRHIERNFKSIIGINPKLYSKIIRFQHAIKNRNNIECNNLTQLATHAGYSDQSHFIRDFKNFSNLKPKEYFYQLDRLGVGFTSLTF